MKVLYYHTIRRNGYLRTVFHEFPPIKVTLSELAEEVKSLSNTGKSLYPKDVEIGLNPKIIKL